MRRIDGRFDGGDAEIPGGRPSPGCRRAALGTVRRAPELCEIAAAMLPRSTGAVGDRTRYVAHVLRRVAGHRSAVAKSYLVRFFTRRGVEGGTRRVARVVWRVAGHRSAVATSYLVRFFTPSECGRGNSGCCRAHPRCCRIVVGRFPCRPGCYPRRLAHVISSAGVGRARRAGFLARSRSNERAERDRSIWADALAIVRQRAV